MWVRDHPDRLVFDSKIAMHQRNRRLIINIMTIPLGTHGTVQQLCCRGKIMPAITLYVGDRTKYDEYMYYNPA